MSRRKDEDKPARAPAREAPQATPSQPASAGAEPERKSVIADWEGGIPPWVRNRWIAVSAVVVLTLIIFLPGLVSVFLLVIGFAGIVMGGISYLDDVFAAKLPGKLTASRALILGAILVFVGILIGLLD